MTGLICKPVRICEQFKQDDYFHRQIVSMHVGFLRKFSVGIPASLPRVQGNGFRIHHRNLASIAPIPIRNQSFATVNADDISYFKKILGERGVVQDEEKLDDANTDWMRKHKGSSKLMLQPKNTQEVGVFFTTELAVLHF